LTPHTEICVYGHDARPMLGSRRCWCGPEPGVWAVPAEWPLQPCERREPLRDGWHPARRRGPPQHAPIRAGCRVSPDRRGWPRHARCYTGPTQLMHLHMYNTDAQDLFVIAAHDHFRTCWWASLGHVDGPSTGNAGHCCVHRSQDRQRLRDDRLEHRPRTQLSRRASTGVRRTSRRTGLGDPTGRRLSALPPAWLLAASRFRDCYGEVPGAWTLIARNDLQRLDLRLQQSWLGAAPSVPDLGGGRAHAAKRAGNARAEAATDGSCRSCLEELVEWVCSGSP